MSRADALSCIVETISLSVFYRLIFFQALPLNLITIQVCTQNYLEDLLPLRRGELKDLGGGTRSNGVRVPQQPVSKLFLGGELCFFWGGAGGSPSS